MLQTYLSKYGECHVAVNGREAIEAFRSSREQRRPYQLICMDIMMPEVDGLTALERIRALETAAGVLAGEGVKIVMTSALNDSKHVFTAFNELCDAYIAKPVDLGKLMKHLRDFKLVDEPSVQPIAV
jgi:two-component system chemotaxis response regulator CheY